MIDFNTKSFIRTFGSLRCFAAPLCGKRNVRHGYKIVSIQLFISLQISDHKNAHKNFTPTYLKVIIQVSVPIIIRTYESRNYPKGILNAYRNYILA